MNTHEPVFLQAEGMTNFADGRDFVVMSHEVSAYAAPTERNEPYTVTYGGVKLANAVPVSSELSFSCNPCHDRFEGESDGPFFLERSFISHNIWWMYSVFSCPAHLEGGVYLDIFPKLDGGGMTQEWENSFQYLDVPNGIMDSVVAGYSDSKNEYIKRLRKEAEARYLLTPDGIVADNRRAKSLERSLEAEKRQRARALKPGWLERIKGRA